MTFVDIYLPDAETVDYADIEAICGYQSLLCKIFERAGGFELPRVTNPTIREVQSQGLVWLRKVKCLIDSVIASPISCDGDAAQSLSLKVLPSLLDSYDCLYRVCNGTTDYGYLRRVRLKMADRWLAGDKSISQTDVVLSILLEAKRNNRTLESRYSRYVFSVEEDWIGELCRYGRFRDTSLREAYARLGYLLKADLFMFVGAKAQAGLKAAWVKEYAIPNDRIGTLEELDTATLWEYIAFAREAARLGYIKIADGEQQYVRFLSQLASRPDVHPYYKEAIRLDLEGHVICA